MTSKNTELSTTYSSSDVEARWYSSWESGGYFKPRRAKQNKTYSLIMPPPNVTGKLHAGHALDITTQDALIRYKRMKGFETLWVPGMDHAGIATQSVVEKMLYEKEGKTRHEYGRSEFLEKIWKWKEEYGGVIEKQQRSIGASCDWDYSMFTMDPEANQAVKKVFVDLFNEGLIYQADYIVNWDPVLHSAISDAEVEHIEVNGAFYHINYKVVGSDELLEVATTRPETLLGDTAICVHPQDERFKHLIGKKVVVPISNREVSIIADDYVDMEKGTGCLKVTPGHDFNDFEIGRRHGLEVINILNKDGTLNDHGLQYKGLSCKKARTKIVKQLEEEGLFVSKKNHIHQVGHGDRSKAIIEPMVSKQWFLNVEGMAEDAVEAVENNTTRFYPKGWENTYFSWLREPKNWCISRQLWWGHRIPVFYCNACNHSWASEKDESTCAHCKGTSIKQDPDVLDTWFSSGLWPLTTLGWPDKNRMKERGFDKFFPTSTLVTGFDIIFFWVSRMMMMSLKTVGKIPFDKIYIHAIVRDKLGRKMSKSLGNGIDPLDMVAEYGADAVRFTLAAGSGYNRNLNLDPERIAGHRSFINKVWNAFRFIHPFLEHAQDKLPDHSKLDESEKWILGELNATTKEMNISMDEFRYDDSCSAIYSFVYDKFCSWFIELSKPTLHGENKEKRDQRATVLKYCFRKIVALLHPVTPYITEELWDHLKFHKEDLLIIQDYPEFSEELVFLEEQDNMNKFIEIVTSIRNLRASLNVRPKEKVNVTLMVGEVVLQSFLESHQAGLIELGKIDSLYLKDKMGETPKKSIMKATTHSEVFVHLDGAVNVEEQVTRLKKDLLKTEKEHLKYSKKLENAKFMANAPEDVVIEVKANARHLSEKIKSLEKNIALFGH